MAELANVKGGEGAPKEEGGNAKNEPEVGSAEPYFEGAKSTKDDAEAEVKQEAEAKKEKEAAEAKVEAEVKHKSREGAVTPKQMAEAQRVIEAISECECPEGSKEYEAHKQLRDACLLWLKPKMQWLKGKAKSGDVSWLRGQFVTQNLCGEDGNDILGDFDFFSAYGRAQPSRECHSIKFNMLQHTTNLKGMQGILEDGFKAFKETNPTGLKMVFFHVVPKTEDVTKMKETISDNVRGFLWNSIPEPTCWQTLAGKMLDKQDNQQQSNHHEIASLCATSPAFCDTKSRYGNFRFSFAAKDLFAKYEEQFGPDIAFFNLGTFVYNKEVQHAILVAPKDDESVQEFPKLEELEESKDTPIADLSTLKAGYGTWRLLSSRVKSLAALDTPDEDTGHLYSPLRGKPCHWQCLAFAFLLPDERTFSPSLGEGQLTAVDIDKPFIGGGVPYTKAVAQQLITKEPQARSERAAKKTRLE